MTHPRNNIIVVAQSSRRLLPKWKWALCGSFRQRVLSVNADLVGANHSKRADPLISRSDPRKQCLVGEQPKIQHLPVRTKSGLT